MDMQPAEHPFRMVVGSVVQSSPIGHPAVVVHESSHVPKLVVWVGLLAQIEFNGHCASEVHCAAGRHTLSMQTKLGSL